MTNLINPQTTTNGNKQQHRHILLITDVLSDKLLEYNNNTNIILNSNYHNRRTTFDILYLLTNYSNIIDRSNVFQFYNRLFHRNLMHFYCQIIDFKFNNFLIV